MKLGKLYEKNNKKLEEDISEIKNVVFELNGLVMEMPIIEIEEVDQKEKKNLVKRIESVHTNAKENMSIVDSMNNKLDKKEAREYIIKLNTYINALLIFVYNMKIYTDHFIYKFNYDRDINMILTYYTQLVNEIVSFSTKYEKYIK